MVRVRRFGGIAFAVLLGLSACEKQGQETSQTPTVEQTVGLEVKPEERTALDAYVEVRDPVYGWKEVSSFAGEGYTGHVLELTSQSWRTETDVDRPVWTHWLTVLIPAKVTSDKALLFIGGGDNGDPAPTKASDRAARIAVETQTVVADLGMVPNQPLYFTDTPKTARYEDDLIAYSRVKHFTTKDDTWLVRLAMVKSGVRAMDAVQEFIASRQDAALKVNEFVVAGGSKRGWTTWLVGAVDPRVIAIMPLVIDALNSEAITRHHFEVLGFFAPSLQDYVNNGLFPHKIGTPEYQEVLAIEDPYNYRGRARLTIPKFLMNASGDEFFLPDNSQFYYADLPAEKRLRYVPNSRHNLAETDAVDSMLAFYRSVIDGKSRPEYSWTKESDGTLIVKTETKPSAVTLWQATNPNARDFRVEEIGKAYTSTPLEAQADGSFVAKIAPPEKGFTAFFIELTFDSGASTPFKFSTEVSIVPNVIPYKFEDAAAKYPLKTQP
ncbi:MAG: PhoPQ-activated pathogenicity [Alphaproteobacteria bacterium]|nr:PhoPQ-activated pathogenicity [Alphaproteobacteria bacterium]